MIPILKWDYTLTKNLWSAQISAFVEATDAVAAGKDGGGGRHASPQWARLEVAVAASTALLAQQQRFDDWMFYAPGWTSSTARGNALVVLALILAIGMAWSRLYRRWPGQATVDEVDEGR
jgi:hypothetical protein